MAVRNAGGLSSQGKRKQRLVFRLGAVRMKALAKLRQWANQDDGRFYQTGNRRLGVVETIGLVLFVAGIFVRQLHVEFGISRIWSYPADAVGLLLAMAGNIRSST